MLEVLHIENIAVIEEADIQFRPGFNALTGETGAGKSIVIDAMGAVLGGRTSRELIRTGADKAFVSASFSGVSPDLPGLAEDGVVPEEDGTLLLENLPLLDQLGFGCEDFGGGAILVREVPADIDAADVSATLEELAECLRTGRSAEERRENLLHTMACKAAIKGGWTSDPAELRALVEKVQSGEVRYCPHGRPVAVKLTRYELEKMFKRA